LNLNPGSYQSDERGSQVDSQAFLGSFVQLELASSAHWERGSLPLDQHGLVAPGRGGPPRGPGTLRQQQEGENTALQILDECPRNVVEGLRQRGHQNFQETSLLIRPATTQQS
jgi:hypothetical protein